MPRSPSSFRITGADWDADAADWEESPAPEGTGLQLPEDSVQDGAVQDEAVQNELRPRQLEPASPPRVRRKFSYRYTRRQWHYLFAVVDLLGGWFFTVAREWTRRLGLWKPASADPRTILLVQLDHLGDAIFTTSMLPALKARYPQAEIEVLASPAAADVFRARPDVNRVWIYRRYRFVRDGGWGWPASVLLWGLRLRRRQYDLAFDCRGEMPIALLLWLAGAKRRVGWAAGGGGFLLTDSVDFVPGRHEVESRRAMLAQVKIDAHLEGRDCEPSLEPSRQALHSVAQRLAKISGVQFSGAQLSGAQISGANEKLYVLHIGAGTQAKRWPVVHWRELVRRLRLEHHGRVVLVGALSDRGLARRITRLCNSPKVIDWTGRTTVVELAALARMADLFIGADSGPAHVAAASGVPTVVLFSGTNQAEQWTPRGPRVHVVRQPVACSPCHREVCPLADHPCMQDLRPIEVLQAVERALSVVPIRIAA